jgi:hypothetical protein
LYSSSALFLWSSCHAMRPSTSLMTTHTLITAAKEQPEQMHAKQHMLA